MIPTSPAPSLNKGRGVNPGDTPASAPAGRRHPPLNKGRGVNPGDTHHAETGHGVDEARSTKAGA